MLAITHNFFSKKFGIDTRFFIRNGFWVSFRYALTALIGLGTTVIFSRMASKEIYGAYQYILSSVTFLSFLSLPGMNIAALKSVVKGNDYAVFTTIKLSLLSGLTGLLCIIGYGFYNWDREVISLPLLLLVAITFAPFYALNTWYVFYEGRQDFFSVAWRALVVATISFFVLWFLLFIGAPLSLLVGWYFLIGILSSLIFVIEIWWKVKKQNLEKKPVADSTLDVRFGFVVTIQKFVFNASETLPFMIIGSIYGLAEVAIFQVAYFIYSVASSYIGALVSMYLPKLFLGVSLQRKKVITYNLFSGAIAAFGASIFLLIFFPLFFTQEYKQSLFIAWLLVPVLVLLPLRSYLANYLTANKRVSLLISIYFLGNLIAVGMFWILQSYGVAVAGSIYVWTLVLTTTICMLVDYLIQPPHHKIAP